MLPPANRLKKEKEIKNALAGGFGGKFGALAFKAAPNGKNSVRFCFIVSKKISNNAVTRNKVKRRLRAAAAAMLDEIFPGYDCAVIARPGLETKNYQEVADLLRRILSRAGILKISQMSKPIF